MCEHRSSNLAQSRSLGLHPEKDRFQGRLVSCSISGVLVYDRIDNSTPRRDIEYLLLSQSTDTTEYFVSINSPDVLEAMKIDYVSGFRRRGHVIT